MSKPKDVEILDLDGADRVVFGYKKGLLDAKAARAKLIDCGIPEHLLDQVLREGPQFYSDENPPL
jgi:hypothetical protein